jgi:hypothetical protein
MFLYTLALDALNREVHERLQHSREIVSKYFNEVFRIVCSLAVNVIKPKYSEFLNTSREIKNNPGY